MSAGASSADEAPSVGRWRERRLRRATRSDVAAVVCLSLLAALVVMTGRRAACAVQPRSAVELAGVLDDLELPSRLPNAPLKDNSGKNVFLYDCMHGPRAVVAFYAEWCGPCQKELPQLVEQLNNRAEILVVVSADEDIEATRRALANLELARLGFLVDVSGQLQKEGRVTALPTTFLLTRTVAVLARTRGFSYMEVFRLARRVKGDQDALGASPAAEPE